MLQQTLRFQLCIHLGVCEADFCYLLVMEEPQKGGESLLKLSDYQKPLNFFKLKWSRTLSFCPISQFSS